MKTYIKFGILLISITLESNAAFFNRFQGLKKSAKPFFVGTIFGALANKLNLSDLFKKDSEGSEEEKKQARESEEYKSYKRSDDCYNSCEQWTKKQLILCRSLPKGRAKDDCFDSCERERISCPVGCKNI